jgi:hypothetical protein
MISSQGYESHHLGDGKVGVFDELLPVVRETGHCRAVDDSVVAAVAYVYDLALDYLAILESWEGLEFADCYDTSLRG